MDVMTCTVQRRLAAGFFAAALICAATGVTAEPVVRHQRVSYADLDLNSQAGVQTLQRRIRAAVKLVCGPTPELRELNEMRAERDCRHRAMEQAAAKVELAIGGTRVASR
jgi:UrcA family protein